jgi:hypothetical protein
MDKEAFQKKWRECQFCRVARYAIIFALGVSLGFGYAIWLGIA